MTQWLTVDEAASYIKARDGRIIRAAIKKGDLRAFRYGTKDIRIDAADVDDWLKTREVIDA